MTLFDKIILEFCFNKLLIMKLREQILEILKRGAKLKSREILLKLNLLEPNNIYSVTDINKTIYHELKNTVFFDKSTYKYYMLENDKMILNITNAEMILNSLQKSNHPLSLIDISNYIKLKYNKNIKIDELQEIILFELSENIGIDNSNPSFLKYFIVE